MASNAQQLDADEILETVQALGRRIRERFPAAGLNHVSAQLLAIARQARVRASAIAAPIYGVRVLSGLVVTAILVVFAYIVWHVRFGELSGERLGAAESVQVLEAAFNAVLLIGATVLFLVTLESRVKRRRALQAIHELRVIAHIIDMHQLTKDPERVFVQGPDTKSSPRRTMSRFELDRYLDYCSEMLSLAGKVAALYVQGFEDAQVVAAVNDIESLTSGLSRKIWQKIMILHMAPEGKPV